MRVPLFDMAAELASVRTDVERAITRVLDSGVFIGGNEVTGFERELAQAMAVSHAIGTSSCTDALHALGMALGVGAGDEIVTTPFTFAASAIAFARLGARIVLADIADDALTLDPIAAASACSPRTRAVVTVNLFGALATIPTVPCPVIEDSAQSIGAGKLRGIASALSFFPTKNLGALGDGGAVLTNDGELASRVALVRAQGAHPKYRHTTVGGNFRLDALQAAVLREKLPHLTTWTAKRREHASRYRDLFHNTRVPDEIVLPPSRPEHVFHQFVIRAPRRDELRAYLADNGIGTEIYYPAPLHLQPAFAKLGYREGAFPIAERACHSVLAIPIHPALTEDSQAFVVERIAAFYRTR